MNQPMKNVTYQPILDYKVDPKPPDKITALYCRLSKDEQDRSESVSIENQRKILLKFCQDNGFRNPEIFVDDGETGVFFDRPGLNAMLTEIRAGKVSTVIIKDQSRIGREVIEIGLLKRTFEEFNVRFLSAEDGLDTAKGFDIMSLLRDVFNEWYVADTSRKIRSVFQAKGMAGDPLCTIIPYGYRKDPSDPKHWIIDQPAASVVRQIFQYVLEGLGPTHIANRLQEARVERPLIHASNAGIRRCKSSLDPYGWKSSTVIKILERREYLGHTINFKTFSKSYKNRKRHPNDPNEYAVFENTHEAIIEEGVFERVQQIRGGKRRRNSSGRVSLLSGLVYCADCKSKMYFSSGASLAENQDCYVCSGFRTKKKQCQSSHYIRQIVLEQMVLEHIQKVTAFATKHEEALVKMLHAENTDRLEKEMAADKKSLAQSERRIQELDNIIRQLYEDKAAGILSAGRFFKLSQGYEQEQEGLTVRTESLKAQTAREQENRMNVDHFLVNIRRYTRITELTAAMLNELVERIEVYARDRCHGNGVQQIKVYFNYVGEIGKLALPPDPPPEEVQAIPTQKG